MILTWGIRFKVILMTIEYRQKALEALDHYNITATEIELLRHNENLTYRVGNEYLLQIHEPTERVSAEFFYDGVDRVEIYKSELDFQAYGTLWKSICRRLYEKVEKPPSSKGAVIRY